MKFVINILSMHRVTTLLFLLLVCTNNSGRSQTSQVNLLLSLEQDFFSSQNDSIKSAIVLQKIDVHLSQLPISDQVLIELKRVDPEYLSLENRSNYFWNASLVNYSLDRPYHTLHYLQLYESNIEETTVDFELLKYLSYMEYDTSAAHRLFENLVAMDSSLNCLSCIEETRYYELKHKQARIIASYFFPGIGIAITGRPLKGLLSFSLNVLSAAAITYTIQQQLWVNTSGWGFNLIGKFYTGNVRLLLKTIDEKEQAQKKKLAIPCELQLKQILQRYPLNFRLSSQ